ncbi:MAG: putative photosynthetic complex assembly protein PuhE [Hoeflea sp.]|uniref:putative photosynthetic complex assembly protein PuhE n=1 Tax=Hoeflea sp. TaxID=1940281 RepID=UPI00273177D6|nr:putative photosynthetic complex assembly protein PuhE [Hoeflea sp.]MDP2122371.1 putative photosynthetic complex assembly protein PuhE [Hoeflea sp.]
MIFLSAVLIASAAWWVATGLVLALARAGNRHFKTVMALATGVATIGVFGLVATAGDGTTALSAYFAFFSALALWAWHETTFLIGLVTGPRRIAAGDAPREKTRFRAAFLTVRDHEIALFATVLGLVWFMSGVENTTGLLAFSLLWVMRISTKLNIYLGARHAISDMLPDRLSYLKSYFRTDRTSGWFYVSLSGSALLLVWLVFAAATAETDHGAVKWTLLAAFAGLALIEHMFLVLPVRDSALWGWAMDKTKKKSPSKNRENPAKLHTPESETSRAAARA